MSGALGRHRYETLENQPFKGSYVPLERYGTDPTTQSLMLEIRKDIYMNEATLTPNELELDRLAAAIAEAAIEALQSCQQAIIGR